MKAIGFCEFRRRAPPSPARGCPQRIYQDRCRSATNGSPLRVKSCPRAAGAPAYVISRQENTGLRRRTQARFERETSSGCVMGTETRLIRAAERRAGLPTRSVETRARSRPAGETYWPRPGARMFLPSRFCAASPRSAPACSANDSIRATMSGCFAAMLVVSPGSDSRSKSSRPIFS